MGSIGVGELLLFSFSLAGILAFVGWVSRVMKRGKRRIEAEKTASLPRPPDGATREVKVIEKEKIIERQVVVVRCQYCKKLTPADLRVCEHCGASQ